MANVHASDESSLALSLISQLNLDGWQNLLSGLGTTLDKSRYNQFIRSSTFTEETITALVDESDIAHRIVCSLPEEATRPGYELQHPKAEQLKTIAEELDFDCELLDCWIWGRAYGGSILVVAAEDGKRFEDPILPDGPVKRINFVRCVPRWNSDPSQINRDPRTPRFGLPEYYNVVLEGWTQQVHHSRVIRFDGAPTSHRERMRQNSWTNSILRAPYDAMQNFDAAWASVGTMMQEAVVSKFGMKGLIAAIASGGRAEENVLRRMQLANSGKSVARAVVHDSDNETFSRDSIAFSGIGEILNQSMYRLTAAANMPMTKLFGRAPAGMNATGESDMRQWYDNVESGRQQKLKPALMFFYSLACRIISANPAELEIKFNPLWQETKQEELQSKKLQAEIDDIYIGNGTLLPEEVATSRFTETGFAYETQLDTTLRKTESDQGVDTGTVRTIEFTPTDQKVFTKLREARAVYGLPEWPDKDEAELALVAFEAKQVGYGDVTGTAEGKEATGQDVTATPPTAPQAFPGTAQGTSSEDPAPTPERIPDRPGKPVPPNPNDDPERTP